MVKIKPNSNEFYDDLVVQSHKSDPIESNSGATPFWIVNFQNVLIKAGSWDRRPEGRKRLMGHCVKLSMLRRRNAN